MEIKITNNIEIENVAYHTEKEVKKHGTGAYVVLPKKYIGHKVHIIVEEKSPYQSKIEAIERKEKAAGKK